MSTTEQQRVAVVTGAASGIGRGLARVAARRGYAVVLTDWHPERLREAVDELGVQGYRVVGEVADVSVYSDVERVVQSAVQKFGRIDLLFNNAGIEATAYLWEMDPQSWGRVLDINTKGIFNCLRAALPIILNQPGEAATIVNTASMASIGSGPSRQSAYNASKHAVLAATECLKIELEEVGSAIKVHAVLPGPVASRIFTDAQAQGQTAAAHQAVLDGFVTEQGMSGDEAAEVIFAGIDANQFWILTHPSMFDVFVERRAELLRTRTAPAAVEISV